VFPAVFPLQVKPDEHLPTGLASNQHWAQKQLYNSSSIIHFDLKSNKRRLHMDKLLSDGFLHMSAQPWVHADIKCKTNNWDHAQVNLETFGSLFLIQQLVQDPYFTMLRVQLKMANKVRVISPQAHGNHGRHSLFGSVEGLIASLQSYTWNSKYSAREWSNVSVKWVHTTKEVK
jgi:hypothetical protein